MEVERMVAGGGECQEGEGRREDGRAGGRTYLGERRWRRGG